MKPFINYNNTNMAQSLPSFAELTHYIYQNPRATICQIRDNFNQKGDFHITVGKRVIGWGMNSEFCDQLQEFMKEDYVQWDTDSLACFISNNTRWTGPGKFLPLVLSIKDRVFSCSDGCSDCLNEWVQKK